MSKGINPKSVIEMEEDPIQVHCRVKPSPSSASFLRVDHSNGTVWADAGHSCRFHHVFGPEASQRHVFEQTALPLLESVCKGFNATLLAYGQTGSGKTHTICGDLVGDNQGIIPRVAGYLLEQLDQGKLDQVQFSVLEVYLGELYDLSSRTQNVSKLTIRERPNGDTFVQNLRTFNLVDFDDFVKRFQTASEIRKVAATRQNDRSTRSHLIATFRVQGVNSQGVRFDSLFNLGDLSGSERVSKSGVEGKEFEQAVNINLDLHTLRTVVLRIKEKGFPSFRENSLTRLLQNSIEGNCKTRIIFAVRTEPESLNDTIGTIQFALDCSFLKNKVSVSRVKTIESLERQLADQAQGEPSLSAQ
jgi:kinesin family protein 11